VIYLACFVKWLSNPITEVFCHFQVHHGIGGIVKDSHSGEVIVHARITIDGIPTVTVTTDSGYFWRVLLPGTYFVQASLEGYHSMTKVLY